MNQTVKLNWWNQDVFNQMKKYYAHIFKDDSQISHTFSIFMPLKMQLYYKSMIESISSDVLMEEDL